MIYCKECKFAYRDKDGNQNSNDIVCTYWMTDGMTYEDYCSRGEAGEYQFDENCNMEGVI